MSGLLIAFASAWLMLGLLDYALIMKDWRSKPENLRPHAWLYALMVAPLLIAFGPVGLIIRDYMHIHFPEWYDHD